MEEKQVHMWRGYRKRSYFNKVFVQNSLSLHSVSPAIRMFLSSWKRENMFHLGIWSPAFGKKMGGRNVLHVPAVFKVSLAQVVFMPKWHILGWQIHPLFPALFICGFSSFWVVWAILTYNLTSKFKAVQCSWKWSSQIIFPLQLLLLCDIQEGTKENPILKPLLHRRSILLSTFCLLHINIHFCLFCWLLNVQTSPLCLGCMKSSVTICWMTTLINMSNPALDDDLSMDLSVKEIYQRQDSVWLNLTLKDAIIMLGLFFLSTVFFLIELPIYQVIWCRWLICGIRWFWKNSNEVPMTVHVKVLVEMYISIYLG